MSTDESPLDWLQTQVVTDLKHWRDLEAAYAPNVEREGEVLWSEARDRVADGEAKLAVIGLCEAQLPVDVSHLDEHYQDGRDDDEIMRDEALAELADDILALLADGYRHREGWADHWACPGCGKPVREVPAGHSWAIPLEGGPWTCRDLGAVSPEEFTRAPDQA